MVVMFVGCLVLSDDPNIILFLPYKTYGAAGFCFRPNPNSGYAVNDTNLLPSMLAYCCMLLRREWGLIVAVERRQPP